MGQICCGHVAKATTHNGGQVATATTPGLLRASSEGCHARASSEGCHARAISEGYHAQHGQAAKATTADLLQASSEGYHARASSEGCHAEHAPGYHTRNFSSDHTRLCGDRKASNAEDKGGCAILGMKRRLRRVCLPTDSVMALVSSHEERRALIWDRPRVVYHRVYFGIRRLN